MVHINRLKKSCYQTPWSFENARRPRQKTRQLDTETLDGNVEIKSRPIATSDKGEPQVVETQRHFISHVVILYVLLYNRTI